MSSVLALGLSGCLGLDREMIGLAVAEPANSPLRADPTLLIATTRRVAGEGTVSPYFSADRGRGLTFARARLNPPSDSNYVSRLASGANADWAIARLDRRVTAEAARAFAEAASGRDVLLYIHGYNETFETAATGAAALADGIGFKGQAGMFAWPSGGRLINYGYDRESALWTRDALIDVLRTLSASPSIGRVHIVAHSMGAFLVLEALRQLAALEASAKNRIGALVLASPDVDIDQFENAVKALGPLSQRITVISATNDRALAVSARLAGGIARAGASERERLEALGVRVADASEHGGWSLVRHDLFLTNEDVRSVIARAVARSS
ncbi:MAG: alpha/beta hydrolase [Bosea sp. (in: a-proteobacteria)]